MSEANALEYLSNINKEKRIKEEIQKRMVIPKELELNARFVSAFSTVTNSIKAGDYEAAEECIIESIIVLNKALEIARTLSAQRKEVEHQVRKEFTAKEE